MQFIPPQPKKRLQDFVGAFPLIRPIPAHTIQQPHKPPIHRLRHVGWHTVKHRTSSDTRYQRHTGTPYRPAQPPYYNKVYKGATVCPVMDPCQTVQQIADRASPAGSAPTVCGSLASAAPGAPAEGSASPPVQGQPGTLHPARQSSGRGAAGGAELLTATAVSFSGFRPIANRGQR